MTLYAIISRDRKHGHLAVTANGAGTDATVDPYYATSSQFWKPIFYMGPTLAGIAFLNDSDGLVTLSARTDGTRRIIAQTYLGENTDDSIIWSFTAGSAAPYLVIKLGLNTKYVMNAAGGANPGTFLCAYDSGGDHPNNEQWRLLKIGN
jgi:hypothetical protein